jgi:transposase-like protein
VEQNRFSWHFIDVRHHHPFSSGIFERAKANLYSFYRFPEAIRQALYTTNLIERSNKGLKHKSKIKEQFPYEDALDRFVCCHYSDLNRTYAEKVQRGFMKVSSEILEMFEQQAQESAA